MVQRIVVHSGAAEVDRFGAMETRKIAPANH